MSNRSRAIAFIPGILAAATLVCCLLSLFGKTLPDGDLVPWAADHGMPPHRIMVEAVRGFGGFFWNSTYYLGGGRSDGALLYPNWPILAFLPLGLSFTANIIVHLLWAGFGAWLCARIFGVSRWGAAISAVAFGLSTHTISLLYPGHIAKIQALVWIPWTVGFFWKAWRTGKPRDFMLAALCFAPAMQSGEPQIPLYLGLFLPIIALFGILNLRTNGELGASTAGGRLALSVACALLTAVLAFQSISTYAGWMGGVRPGAAAGNAESAEGHLSPETQKAKWDFATGWSFPPEDSLTFLLSGQIFGGRSPGYFGRMGTGTMKLKETDDYVGVLVLFLALFALGGIKRSSSIVFLVLVLLSSLLIGYGRYTPIYRLIYSLPTMASQRVPARWIAFTVFAFSILAGFGLDRLLSIARSEDARPRKRLLILPGVMAAIALLLVIVQLMTGAGSADFAQKAFGANGFIANSPQANLAEMRAERFLYGLQRAQVLLFIGAALLAVGSLNRLLARTEAKRQIMLSVVAGGCILLTGVDLALNAKHFIEPYNWRQYHQADGLVNLLRSDPELFRVQPIGTQRHPVLNRMVGPVGPWNGLRFTEQTSMNVLPADIAKAHKALSQGSIGHRFNPRYYDLFNVKYVLTPFELPPEILGPSKLRLTHRMPYGATVQPLLVYEYAGFTPYPSIATSTRNVETEEALLALVASPSFSPSTEVAGIGLPKANSQARGTAALKEYGKARIAIAVETDGPCWLVMQEHFDTHWKAQIDGEEREVYRLNYLHFGVPLATGKHEVEFRYRPPRTKLMVTAMAWFIAIGYVVMPYARSRKSE